MQEKLTRIFKEAKYEPDAKLASSVWQKIVMKERSKDLVKLWSFSFVGFLSLVGLIPTLEELFNDLAHSGFYEYFSLIFSDGGSLVNYWKELLLSLAESLPVMSIIFTLSLFFICFLSLKYIVKQIGKNQLTNSLILTL